MAEDLRFSIEESVWLNKGQEVDEIISMSLEPDISIVENKHYVSVRGVLKLTGEYQPLKSDEEDAENGEPPIDEDRPLRDQVGFRPVDELLISDAGTAEIEHHFPVDITIPLSRIDQLEDIYVTVDAFDYTLPENDCIRLDADVSISGMVEDQPESKAGEADQGPELEETEVESAARASEVQDDETYSEITAEVDTEKVYEPFHYEAVREATEEEPGETNDEVAAEEKRGPLVEMKSRTNKVEEHPALSKYAESDLEEEEEDEKVEVDRAEVDKKNSEEEPQREENALYLTKMLTKEEEAFSRLKMCIIQPGDSLDSIAERYELQPSQLVRVNDLGSEDVEEGQIIYIPVHA